MGRNSACAKLSSPLGVSQIDLLCKLPRPGRSVTEDCNVAAYHMGLLPKTDEATPQSNMDVIWGYIVQLLCWTRVGAKESKLAP